jgi:HSP20 family protein
MILRSLQTPSRYAFAHLAGTPFLSIHRALQRSMDENFGTCQQSGALSVRLDVKEDEKAYTVTADLPGLNDKEVEVTFDDGTLAIRGEKKLERDETKETWHIAERRHGAFARELALPENVKADGIEAKFDKGVLTIVLPKQAESPKPTTKIAIKTS